MSKKNEATATVTVQDDRATQIAAIAGDKSKNVSVRIRELAALDVKRGDIVKALTAAGYVTKNGSPIRFQHVRNVLITPVKKVG